MTSGLVNVSFSLPEWQAVKMIFFAPCLQSDNSTIDRFRFTFMATGKWQTQVENFLKQKMSR